MIVARLLAGLCALFLGRQLFWLFVGVVGFALGMDIATRAYWGQPDSVVVTIALAAGVVGAVLALVLQELMIRVVGFVAGGYIGALLLATTVPYPGRYLWLAFLVGGLVGALLLGALFNWALIVLSSLFGAALLVQHLPPGSLAGQLGFVVLAIVGVVVQSAMRRRWPAPLRV